MVADGVVNAIQNAVTSVAMEITVRCLVHEGSRRRASLADPNENSVGRPAFVEAIVEDVVSAVNSDKSDVEAWERAFGDIMESGRFSS